MPPELTRLTAQRLTQYLEPSCVILFGSRQRGKDGARSDLDLLVVADSDCSPAERRGQLDRLFAHWPIRIDALWLTPEEAAYRIHAGNGFLISVIRGGQVISGDCASLVSMLPTPAAE